MAVNMKPDEAVQAINKVKRKLDLCNQNIRNAYLKYRGLKDDWTGGLYDEIATQLNMEIGVFNDTFPDLTMQYEEAYKGVEWKNDHGNDSRKAELEPFINEAALTIPEIIFSNTTEIKHELKALVEGKQRIHEQFQQAKNNCTLGINSAQEIAAGWKDAAGQAFAESVETTLKNFSDKMVRCDEIVGQAMDRVIAMAEEDEKRDKDLLRKQEERKAKMERALADLDNEINILKNS